MPQSGVCGCEAHPRAGGENMFYETELADARGSSPRRRGKQACAGVERARDGLIPARAGKTTARISARAASRAHPRAGGENVSLVPPAMALTGSSPHGRGKLLRVADERAVLRLIPAWTGKTLRSPRIG